MRLLFEVWRSGVDGEGVVLFLDVDFLSFGEAVLFCPFAGNADHEGAGSDTVDFAAHGCRLPCLFKYLFKNYNIIIIMTI